MVQSGVDLIVLDADADTRQHAEWSKSISTGPGDKDRIFFIPVPHNSIWVRDFGPFTIFQPQPEKNDSDFETAFVDFDYRSESHIDDAVPYFMGMYFNKSVVRSPIHLDGGNFLTNGEDCLLANDFILQDESLNQTEHQQLLRQAAENKARALLTNTMGCKKTIFIDDAPHEHIDMWAKFVSKNELLINEIPAEAYTYARENFPHLYNQIAVAKASLDKIALQLAKNYKVTRLPMPLPFGNIFRTYANAVLLNETILIPSYKKDLRSNTEYIDQKFITDFEKQVAKTYASFGYQTKFINADSFIKDGGAFHCISVQIPKEKNKLTLSRVAKKYTDTQDK